jgi:hypothetical protein
MSATDRQDAHRRLGRQWAARVESPGPIGSLSKLGGRIASAIAQALQDVFGGGGKLSPIPVRATVKRRPDRRRSHD